MANKEFGEILRRLRNENGYTQQQVADMLGLKNKSTLGSWEVGKSEPDGYSFLRLMQLYNVKDIYEAFGQENPVKESETISSQIVNAFDLLKPEYQSFILDQINNLLELQNNERKPSLDNMITEAKCHTNSGCRSPGNNDRER